MSLVMVICNSNFKNQYGVTILPNCQSLKFSFLDCDKNCCKFDIKNAIQGFKNDVLITHWFEEKKSWLSFSTQQR